MLVPKASESKGVALRAISQIALAYGPHGCEPHWFSELDVAHLSGEVLKVEVSNVGFKSFTPQGEALGFEFPPVCGLLSLGWCLGQASPTYFDVNLYLFTH